MTTQTEVIEAFAHNEMGPRRASNFKMELVGNGSKAYLIGGNDAVFAKREPLNQVAVYTAWADRRFYGYYSASIGLRGIRRQARKVRNTLVGTSLRDPRIDPDEANIEVRTRQQTDGSFRPTVGDFDDIK